MRTTMFGVPIFDVDVVLIKVEGKDDKDNVLKELDLYNLTEEMVEEVKNAIENGYTDGARTFWNGGIHTAIIIFYLMESDERARVCYDHEKRHLEDRILGSCGIEDTETAAYIAGWLTPYFDSFRENKTKK